MIGPQNPHSPPNQQPDRSNDPVHARAKDEIAARRAMTSRQAFAGGAHGVGGVEFEDPGAFDVGTGERPVGVVDPAEADDAPADARVEPQAPDVDNSFQAERAAHARAQSADTAVEARPGEPDPLLRRDRRGSMNDEDAL